jgi:hypothetical protein
VGARKFIPLTNSPSGAYFTAGPASDGEQLSRRWLVAARRYDDRAQTCHPVHVVTTLTAAARAEYDQPVGFGQLITVNTERPVDVPEVAAAVRARLAAPVRAGLRSAGPA